MRAFRYETLNGYKYKGIRPFFKELFLDTLSDNEVVILNSGHHEIHFYMATEDLVAEVSKFVDKLVATPRWKSRAARATGSLFWRTMTPTEFPPRHRISWMKSPVDLYKALDEEVTAVWTSAGFPVINLSGMVFDSRGNSQRFLTYDSMHFTTQALEPISRSVLSQLCAFQKERSW